MQDDQDSSGLLSMWSSVQQLASMSNMLFTYAYAGGLVPAVTIFPDDQSLELWDTSGSSSGRRRMQWRPPDANTPLPGRSTTGHWDILSGHGAVDLEL